MQHGDHDWVASGPGAGRDTWTLRLGAVRPAALQRHQPRQSTRSKRPI